MPDWLQYLSWVTWSL